MFSVILNIYETEQLQIGNWVKARQNCLVLTPILFTPPTRTRQDKTRQFCHVRVGGVNKLLPVNRRHRNNMYTVSQKLCKFVFVKTCQIFTNFDNVRQKDGKDAKIMRGALIFHFILFASPHYRVKRRCSKLLHNAESCYLQ